MTTRRFCTYFDKNFLVRAVALHGSLSRHCPDFVLWMLPFDRESAELLKGLDLPNVRLVSLADFEDERLLAAKKTRSPVEYYWTCTPSLPLYVLKRNPGLDMVAYVDADLYFYSSPEPVYGEFGDRSVMIIPHRYSKEHVWREETSGTYNVGMLVFRNDESALECLEWWRERCLEWCYARYEDGRYGDQRYLDSWPKRFKDVHVLEHKGANLASWNIKNFRIGEDGAGFTVSGDPLVFFHFHGLKIYRALGKARFYPVQVLHRGIYETYRNALDAGFEKIAAADRNWRYGLAKRLDPLRWAKQSIVAALRRLLA